MHLSIGCRIELRCETATPLLALVHVHSSLAPDLIAPDRLQLQPDHTDPVLPGVRQCPIEALPIDAYRFLNASTYCAPP